MARRCFQRGHVYLRRGKRERTWYGIYRTDVINNEGAVRRRSKKVRLGGLDEIPTKTEARQRLRAMMELPQKPSSTLTLSELCERWRLTQVPTLKPSTAAYYQKALKPTLKAFGSREVRELGRHEIEVLIEGLRAKYSRNSIRGVKIALSRVLGWAVNNGWIDKNPTRGLRLPRTESCGGRCVERRVLTPKQVAAIARNLEEPFATLVLLLAATGLRISEALALEWPDLDGGLLRIRRRLYEGKTDEVKSKGSNRCLPIPPKLVRRLRALRGEGDLVFQSSAGTSLNPRNVMRRQVLPAARKAGIQSIGGFHSLRHSFTVQLLREGTHPKLMAALLGHSDTGQLAMDVYADHVEVGDLKKPMRRIGSLVLPTFTKSELRA